MKKRYKSELLGVLYEDAVADFEVGGISAERMKFWEQKCLVPEVPHATHSAHKVSPRPPSPANPS